jgi:hypothetical protein
MPERSGYAVAQAIRQSFTDVRRPLMIAISGVWKEFTADPHSFLHCSNHFARA